MWLIVFDYEHSVRWRRGPQIGERQVSITYITNPQTGEASETREYGDWTWYNLLGRRVEGPEQGSFGFKMEYRDGLTYVGGQLTRSKET